MIDIRLVYLVMKACWVVMIVMLRPLVWINYNGQTNMFIKWIRMVINGMLAPIWPNSLVDHIPNHSYMTHTNSVVTCCDVVYEM